MPLLLVCRVCYWSSKISSPETKTRWRFAGKMFGVASLGHNAPVQWRAWENAAISRVRLLSNRSGVEGYDHWEKPTTSISRPQTAPRFTRLSMGIWLVLSLVWHEEGCLLIVARMICRFLLVPSFGKQLITIQWDFKDQKRCLMFCFCWDQVLPKIYS